MRDEYQSWFYLPAGATAAIVLGMVLTPMRERTSAGNFTFLFVILIVVVAELGGRAAAIVTAASSALSLDFFLTRPYLHLMIDDKHDLIAFVGLAICGAVAAAIGSGRGQRIAALDAARSDLDLLRASLDDGATPGPVADRMAVILRRARESLPLAGALLRDITEEVVAVSGPRVTERAVPGSVLDRDTLLPADVPAAHVPRRGLPLPLEGGIVVLECAGRRVGRLDLWGNGAAATLESRRTLAAIARLLASMMVAESPAVAAPSD